MGYFAVLGRLAMCWASFLDLSYPWNECHRVSWLCGPRGAPVMPSGVLRVILQGCPSTAATTVAKTHRRKHWDIEEAILKSVRQFPDYLDIVHSHIVSEEDLISAFQRPSQETQGVWVYTSAHCKEILYFCS